MTAGDRSRIGGLLDRLVSGWARGSLDASRADFAPGARLVSTQHGTVAGAAEILGCLAQDGRRGGFAHRASNRYIGIDGDAAAASLYLSGLMQDGGGQSLLFGATLVARLARGTEGWQIDDLRFEVIWTRGRPRVAAHWLHVPGDRGWQPGDPAPAIVSELHAPWRLLPGAAVPAALEDALPELYARYAFAVDHNDFGLLAGVYAADISGGFAPLGNLEGRDVVIGMLNSFRQLAAFWQHVAEVVAIEAESDGRHARMIVGRIIPERPADEAGRPLYGAHYQLRARREEDGWRICRSDYRPGWFTRQDVPAFDLALLAG